VITFTGDDGDFIYYDCSLLYDSPVTVFDTVRRDGDSRFHCGILHHYCCYHSFTVSVFVILRMTLFRGRLLVGYWVLFFPAVIVD